MTVPSYVIVLPAIDPGLADDCLASMAPELLERVFLVDNTETREIARAWAKRVLFASAPGRNTGVSAPWNQGIALATAMHCNYVILLSQSITFGEPGGADFLDELTARRPEWLMHSQHGWKLLAISHAMSERVGHFDPEFPSYMNETDWLRRAHLSGLPSPEYNGGEYDQINVDAASAGDAVALRRGLVRVNFSELSASWLRKWGGEKLHETFDRPYDDDRLDHSHVGPPPIRTKETA